MSKEQEIQEARRRVLQAWRDQEAWLAIRRSFYAEDIDHPSVHAAIVDQRKALKKALDDLAELSP